MSAIKQNIVHSLGPFNIKLIQSSLFALSMFAKLHKPTLTSLTSNNTTSSTIETEKEFSRPSEVRLTAESDIQQHLSLCREVHISCQKTVLRKYCLHLLNNK